MVFVNALHLLKGRLAGGAKPNVSLAGWQKIVFKKCGWEKNKKHRVGNECRLTRCPLSIWSVFFYVHLSKFVSHFSVFTRLMSAVSCRFYACCQRKRLGEGGALKAPYFTHALR
jgi:hypothetical protein